MSQVSLLHGYPDKIGKRFAYAGDYVGPTSYVQGGDPLVIPGFQNYIDSMHGSISVSGTYLIRPILSASGARATWKVKWIVISTGNEVAAAVNLSGETVRVDGFGGLY